MKTKVTNEFISQLTREWVATLPYRYPLDRENPHQFSQRFLDRMEPVLQAAREEEQGGRKRRRRAMKTTATLLAAALGATVAMAYVAHYFQMVRYDHEKYSFVRYQEVGTGDRSAEFVPYHITYVPDGFVLTEERTTKISLEERYEDYNGAVLVFRQIEADKITFFVDTEGAEIENIQLNGKLQAFYLQSETYNTVYWSDGEYSFRLTGNISKDLLVQTAKSVAENYKQ